MRHLKRGRKLGRSAAHRKALRQNLAIALFTRGRIITTMAKAKEYRPYVEKLITLAKQGIVEKDGANHERYLHCYRREISMLQDKVIAKKLGLSEHTIKIHMTAIFKTLGVSNRTEAAIACRELGFHNPE